MPCHYFRFPYQNLPLWEYRRTHMLSGDRPANHWNTKASALPVRHILIPPGLMQVASQLLSAAWGTSKFIGANRTEMSLVDAHGWDDASILMPIDPSTEIFPWKLCRCFYLSSVQTCLKQIYQGVNLWCLREKKITWRENSRKSFAKEPQKICAAKAPRKYTPPHNCSPRKCRESK
jgi:hypothetical protein